MKQHMINEFHVINVKALDNYKLGVTFADGKSGIVDLTYLKGKGVFKIWDNYHEFEKASIGPISKAVCWGNIDIDPINLKHKLQH